MKNATANSKGATALESGLQAQIASIRQTLNAQRTRAQKMWDDCGAGTGNQEEGRERLGRFTEQLLKGQDDAICS